MALPRRKPLVFRGERRRLSVALPEDWDRRGASPTLELDAPDGELARVRRVRLPAGRGHGLRIVLPPTTPPGSYEGEIAVGADKRSVVVEVSADPQLRIAPIESEITVDPGGEARLTLAALNVGNVAQELPERPPVTFYGPAEGPPTAHDVEMPGLDRFVAITARLERAEGRVAGVEIAEGAGPLATGESRELTLAVQADEALAPGDRYVGEWRVPGDTVAIGLTVGGGLIDERVT